MKFPIVCSLLVLALWPCPSPAQELHRIEGRVVDGRGNAIPAATVRLFSAEPGPPVETLTEEDGHFSFPGLPAGIYRIVVEMTGFQRLTRENVDPAQDAARSLTLQLQRPQPSRAPEGQAARRTPPQAASPDLFQEVGLAAPGGFEDMQSGTAFPGTEAGMSGFPQDNSDLLLISGNSSANIDAGDWSDANFRARMMDVAGRMGFGIVDRPGGGDREGGFGPGSAIGAMLGGGGFDGGGRAGFGGFGGRGRGAMMRQPGLNGSVTVSYRNSALNARPYSLTGIEVDKPLQIQNNFGISVGGPLPWGQQSGTPARGPGRMMRQPGMWFVSYEGGRNRNPYDSLTTVPTSLERAGDFSGTSLRAGPLAGLPITIYDPSATVPTPFPGARIPASRINPAALALLRYVPLPNLPGDVQNFTMQRGLVGTSDGFTARVNTRLGSRVNGFFNYNFRTGDNVTSQVFPGLDTRRANRSQNFMAGGMYRHQPRFIINYRFNFNRVRMLSSNPFSFEDDVAGRLGITGVSRDPINFGIPTINLTNYGDLRLASPSLNRNQTVTLAGGFIRIGPKHTISAGGDVSWNQRNSLVDQNARGTFDFTGFATSAFDAKGRPIAGTGYDLADFLLGLPYSTSRRFGSSDSYLRNRSFNLFVQDNWRVRSNLTVNFGLRYEYILPFYEKYDRLVTLDVAPGFQAVAPAFPDQAGPYSGRFPRSLVYSDRNNFGPRVGIAWKRKPTSRWVFRAGYGLFYNPSVYPYISGQLVGQPPFATNQNILTTLASPLTLQNGFPVDPSVTIRNSYAIDPHYRIGYVQQWNFNIQTQAFRLYTIDVGYNGSKGTRLDILRAPNRAPAGISPGSTEDNRTISNAESFVYQESGANSILHSLQVRVMRRFSRGFRMVSSYIYGKSIDNASGIGGGGLVVVQDERNIAGERSLSSFDQRHRYQTEFNIELPFGERRRFFAGGGSFVQQLISGWNLNGSFQLSSGTPLTARILGNVSNNSGTGSNASERPDSTGQAVALPRGERTTSRYFNTQAFAIPQAGLFGNAGRYTIRGPGANLLNLSLRKMFRLDDSNRRLEFRWEVTNVFNHANFGGVGTVVNALNFGRVTSARAMRQMEFSLRLSF